jgi:hypothetical protein
VDKSIGKPLLMNVFFEWDDNVKEERRRWMDNGQSAIAASEIWIGSGGRLIGLLAVHKRSFIIPHSLSVHSSAVRALHPLP